MRTIVVFALILVGLTSTASAESDASDIHQSTTPPLDARYEVVQSQLAAKWTFRLDRYTGRVSQLVRTEDEGKTWETMIIQGLPEVSTPTRPRFLIFTSGLASRHTFLMDCDTGQTWVLTSVSVAGDVEIVVWKPFRR
jgi:photosystem II stability/assembly factor-like uncharacterized protein